MMTINVHTFPCNLFNRKYSANMKNVQQTQKLINTPNQMKVIYIYWQIGAYLLPTFFALLASSTLSIVVPLSAASMYSVFCFPRIITGLLCAGQELTMQSSCLTFKSTTECIHQHISPKNLTEYFLCLSLLSPASEQISYQTSKSISHRSW